MTSGPKARHPIAEIRRIVNDVVDAMQAEKERNMEKGKAQTSDDDFADIAEEMISMGNAMHEAVRLLEEALKDDLIKKETRTLIMNACIELGRESNIKEIRDGDGRVFFATLSDQ